MVLANLSGGAGGFITLTDLNNTLTAYALTSILNATYVKYTAFNDAFNYFYNRTEMDGLLNNKQNSLSDVNTSITVPTSFTLRTGSSVRRVAEGAGINIIDIAESLVISSQLNTSNT